jgi:hypothetical protein
MKFCGLGLVFVGRLFNTVLISLLVIDLFKFISTWFNFDKSTECLYFKRKRVENLGSYVERFRVKAVLR